MIRDFQRTATALNEFFDTEIIMTATSAFLIAALAIAGTNVHAAVVTSTLPGVVILGTTYDVTFNQNEFIPAPYYGVVTRFNDVFDAASIPVLTFNATNAEAAMQAILSTLRNNVSFEVTPGFPGDSGGEFLIPYAADATTFSALDGAVFSAYGNWIPYESSYPLTNYLRSTSMLTSYVTFSAVTPIPEPASLVLLLGGLGLVGEIVGRHRQRIA